MALWGVALFGIEKNPRRTGKCMGRNTDADAEFAQRTSSPIKHTYKGVFPGYSGVGLIPSVYS